MQEKQSLSQVTTSPHLVQLVYYIVAKITREKMMAMVHLVVMERVLKVASSQHLLNILLLRINLFLKVLRLI